MYEIIHIYIILLYYIYICLLYFIDPMTNPSKCEASMVACSRASAWQLALALRSGMILGGSYAAEITWHDGLGKAWEGFRVTIA